MTASSAPELEHTRQKKPVASIFILSLCSMAITLGLLLPPTSPGNAITILGVQLPETCASVRDFGIECPGCGLTRSWVSVLHGRLAESFAHHRLGWLVLLYAAMQILRHSLILTKASWRPKIESKWGGYLDKSIVLLAGLLFLNWLPYLWNEILLPMW